MSDQSDQNISRLLTNLGWGSGFRLPIASLENRELENALEEKQKHILAQRTRLEEEKHHVESITHELHRVTERVVNSSKLLSAAKATAVHTRNLNCISEKLCERVERDCKLQHKELQNLREMNQNKKTILERRRKGVDELSLILKWDKSELEALKQSETVHDTDIEFMQKYLDVDKKLTSENDAHYTYLAEKFLRSSRELDAIVQQTQTADHQYARLSRQFRRVHDERNQAVHHWKNVLDSLKLRDEEFKQIAMEFIHTRGRIVHVNNVMKRQMELLEVAQQSNREVDASFQGIERTLTEIKLLSSETTQQMLEMNVACQTLRVVIRQTELKFHQSQAKQKEVQKAIRIIYLRLERREAEVVKLRERLSNTKSEAISAEGRLAQMAGMVEETDRLLEATMKELERMEKCKFEVTSRCTSFKIKLVQVDQKLRTGEVTFKKLKRFCKEQDFQLHLSNQKVYKLELHVLIAQNKIRKQIEPSFDGNMSTEYKLNIQKTLDNLRQKLKNILKSKMFLMYQKGHIEDVVRRLAKDLDQPKKEQFGLKDQLRNSETFKMLVMRQASKLVEELQNVRFDMSMEKLRMSRMKKLFQNRRGKIGRLEQSRVLIKAAATERRDDIRIHMAMLQQRKKQVLEYKTKYIACLNDVRLRVKKWQTKYDIITTIMAGSAEEAKHQAFNEAHYLLKASQERELLKREGDKWDARVKESEKELVGLQNTLAVMVNANQSFKESLEPAVKGSPADKLRETLDQNQRAAMVRIRRTRKVSHIVEQRNAEKEREIVQLEQVVRELIGTIQDRKFELESVRLEIASQTVKLDRASLVTRRMVKQMEHKSMAEKQLLETQLKLRCTKEKYKFAIQTLDRAFGQHPQLTSPATHYLKKHREHKMFAKLVKKIETRRNTIEFYSPLHSGSTTPLLVTSETDLLADLDPEPVLISEEQRNELHLAAARNNLNIHK